MTRVSVDELDSVILGLHMSDQIPWLAFDLPPRPVLPAGKFSDDESNFQAFMDMWQKAAEVMRRMQALEGGV